MEYPDFTVPDAEVLVAEDNETSLKIILGALEPLFARTDTAANGEEALLKIREKQYDLIFMDYMMPVMDGIEAVSLLRETEGEYFRDVPVIALTSASDSEVRERFSRAGANDFLSKDFERDEVRGAVRRWLPAELLREGSRRSNDGEEGNTDLPEIEGIDVREGLRHSGTKKLYFGFLESFYKLIDLKAGRIENYLSEGRIRDVTIEVHALKSAAGMLGARELSSDFARLERYGDEGNGEALRRETPEVLRRYRKLRQLLKPFAGVTEEKKKSVSKERLLSLLREVESAMSGFDLDGADGALRELEQSRLPVKCLGDMELLGARVADVAIEDTVKLAKRMRDDIEAMAEDMMFE